MDTGRTPRVSRPLRALYARSLTMPVSTTYLIPLMVTDVSAMLVARITCGWVSTCLEEGQSWSIVHLRQSIVRLNQRLFWGGGKEHLWIFLGHMTGSRQASHCTPFARHLGPAQTPSVALGEEEHRRGGIPQTLRCLPGKTLRRLAEYPPNFQFRLGPSGRRGYPPAKQMRASIIEMQRVVPWDPNTHGTISVASKQRRACLVCVYMACVRAVQ